MCCDGLTGFPEAIEATWPQTTVQTCVVHLIRAAMRFVSYERPQEGRRRAAPDLHRARPPTPPRASCWPSPSPTSGRRYPATVRDLAERLGTVHPVPGVPARVRKIIYTTNAIESLNYQLRKIIKNRGHFPNDDAVVKLLWLAIRDIEDKRARERAKEKGLPADPAQRPRPARRRRHRPGWKAALGALCARRGMDGWPRTTTASPRPPPVNGEGVQGEGPEREGGGANEGLEGGGRRSRWRTNTT